MKARRVPIKKQGIAAPKKPTRLVEPPKRQQMGFQSSQGSSSQPEPLPEINIQHFVENSERFSPRDAEKLVEAWGQAEDALSKMPMAEQPTDLISTLLPYQRQGLAWIMEKENPVLPAAGSKDIVQLWKRHESRPNAFQNIATRFVTSQAPILSKGGILADDMGLGKTLQVISAILEGGSGTTLIVAPVSVMSNVGDSHGLNIFFFSVAVSSCALCQSLLPHLARKCPEYVMLTPRSSSGFNKLRDTSRRSAT